MKKIFALVALVLFSTGAFAQTYCLPIGKIGTGTKNDTITGISGTDTVYLTINTPKKGIFPPKDYIRVEFAVTKIDSIKTHKFYLEGSDYGTAGSWYRINPLTDSVNTFSNSTTSAQRKYLKYGPVDWKFHRLACEITGLQKFFITGGYTSR